MVGILILHCIKNKAHLTMKKLGGSTYVRCLIMDTGSLISFSVNVYKNEFHVKLEMYWKNKSKLSALTKRAWAACGNGKFETAPTLSQRAASTKAILFGIPITSKALKRPQRRSIFLSLTLLVEWFSHLRYCSVSCHQRFLSSLVFSKLLEPCCFV